MRFCRRGRLRGTAIAGFDSFASCVCNFISPGCLLHSLTSLVGYIRCSGLFPSLTFVSFSMHFSLYVLENRRWLRCKKSLLADWLCSIRLIPSCTKQKHPANPSRWVQAHLKKLQIDRRISQPLLCQALQQRQTLIEALGCQCDLAGRGVILHQLPAHLVLG